MNKKAQIGKVLMDVAAFILFLIFVMIFALYFNTCSVTKVDKKVTSVEFNEFSGRTSFWVFSRIPTEQYGIKTNNLEALTWNVVSNSKNENEILLRNIYQKTKVMYPLITIDNMYFSFSNDVTKKSNIHSNSNWICIDNKFNVPHMLEGNEILFVPCYVVNADQQKLKAERLKAWQQERLENADYLID